MTKQVYKKLEIFRGKWIVFLFKIHQVDSFYNFRVVCFDVEKIFGCSYEMDFPSRENDIVQDGAYLRPHTSACSQHFFYLKN